jgi:hypothetical protein
LNVGACQTKKKVGCRQRPFAPPTVGRHGTDGEWKTMLSVKKKARILTFQNLKSTRQDSLAEGLEP